MKSSHRGTCVNSPLFFMLLLASALLSAVGDTRSWLDKNANEDGVTVLRSGVQFRIKKEARRDANSPLSNAPCIVKYRGRLIDGTVFDPGNFDTPAVVKVMPDAAPPGWRSALHHMGEGDLWEVFVDPGLATQVQHLPNAPAPPNDQVRPPARPKFPALAPPSMGRV